MFIDILGHKGKTDYREDTFVFSGGAGNTYGIFAQDYNFSATLFKPIVIGNEQTYNQFVTDKKQNPRKIHGLRMLVNTSKQWDNPLVFVKKDANGNEYDTLVHPLNFLPPTQFQSLIIEIPLGGLLLSEGEFIRLFIGGAVQVIMTVKYEVFPTTYLMGRK